MTNPCLRLDIQTSFRQQGPRLCAVMHAQTICQEAPLSLLGVLGCSATWFQRGQQVRTQAAVKLDHRATLWGT